MMSYRVLLIHLRPTCETYTFINNIKGASYLSYLISADIFFGQNHDPPKQVGHVGRRYDIIELLTIHK